MTIKGKVVYENLGTGFWGIIDANGNKWRPIKMPEQLKYEGKGVTIKAKKLEDDFSIFMWGTAIRITSFSTMTP